MILGVPKNQVIWTIRCKVMHIWAYLQILGPPEGMVPNFEPKNDLKKGQICVFGSFLGPNGPFQLFSHHILCPTGLMKE